MSIYNIHGNLFINDMMIFPLGSNLNINGNIFAPNVTLSNLIGNTVGNISFPALGPNTMTGFTGNIRTFTLLDVSTGVNTNIVVPGNILTVNVLVADTPGNIYGIVGLQPTLIGARQYSLSIPAINTLNISTTGVSQYLYKAFIEYV